MAQIVEGTILSPQTAKIEMQVERWSGHTIESEILEKLQGTSIEERIQVIEAILRTVKSDMRSVRPQQVLAGQVSLKGKVIRYEEPYEPIAVEDWEAVLLQDSKFLLES